VFNSWQSKSIRIVEQKNRLLKIMPPPSHYKRNYPQSNSLFCPVFCAPILFIGKKNEQKPGQTSTCSFKECLQSPLKMKEAVIIEHHQIKVSLSKASPDKTN